MPNSSPHWIAEIRDSLICGCDPQIFSAGEHGDDCPIVLFDGLVEQLEAAHRNMDRYGMALAEISQMPSADGWAKDMQSVAREALNPATKSLCDMTHPGELCPASTPEAREDRDDA